MRFSFAWKLGIAISLLAVLATGGSVLWLYNQTRDLIIDSMRNRLQDIGRAGSFLFDEPLRDDLAYLKREMLARSLQDQMPEQVQNLGDDDYLELLPPEESAELMETPEFLRVVQALRQIREGSRNQVVPLRDVPSLHEIWENEDEATHPTLEYIYIIMPAPGYDPSMDWTEGLLIYLVDSDYLPVDDDGDGSYDGDDDYEGNPIGNMAHPATPEMWEVFRYHDRSVAEKEFSEDQWGDVVISGYVPIVDDNGKTIAVLGMDYNVKSEANRIADLAFFSYVVVAVVFVLSIIVAFLMSRLLTRPIQRLREGAERVADRDFSTQIDVKSKDEMGILANSFNGMVTEIRDYAREILDLNQAYERFVPQEFLKHLGQDNIVKVRLGDQVQREMTVLFSDIRSFTTLSESMTPVENFEFLNAYLKRVSPVIRNNHGFIDKFIGDAIMALFPRVTEDAVRGSIDMQKQVQAFNVERQKEGDQPVRIGIGVHTGMLMLGTIGEDQRMESTVIADAVNLASRLEGLTKRFGTQIIASEYSMTLVENVNDIHRRFLGNIRVKGKSQATRVFEVLDADEPGIMDKKLETNDRFQEGIDNFLRGKFKPARDLFEEVLAANSEDNPARVYFERCETIIARGK